jgi:lipopolysaccharide transport system ATP-binding protein
MYHIQKLCKRAIWIDSGKIYMEGAAADVTRSYLAWHEEKTRVIKDTKEVEPLKKSGEFTSGIYEVKSMLLNEANASDSICLGMNEDLTVSGTVHSPDGRAPNVAVGVVRADGTPIYGVVSEMDGYVLQRINENLFKYSIKFNNLPLLPGRYVARSHALDPEGLRLFDQVEMPFDISGNSRELGYCRLEHQWIDNI